MNNHNKKINLKESSTKILSSLIPIIVGATIGVLGAKYTFTDDLSMKDSLLKLFIVFFVFVVSFFIHLIIHESGHLIFGLLSNYEFISFRIGSITLVKDNGKFLIKKFKIPGTGGQCLMMPTNDNYKECKYILYNLGGVIMNLVISILFFILYITIPTNKCITSLFLSMVASGICIFILNGIPMKISGIANDGYNLISIMKNDLAKYCFYTQLKVHGLLSKGVRFKDMDKQIFEIDENSNFSNPIITSMKCFESNYYTDIKNFDKAKDCCEFLLDYNPKIIKLYENELKCDLLFYEIISDRNEEKINKLYTKQLKAYIKATNCYISRKRLMYAYALIIEKDLIKAEKLLNEFKKVQNTYPIKAEIESELELIDYIKSISKEITV